MVLVLPPCGRTGARPLWLENAFFENAVEEDGVVEWLLGLLFLTGSLA